MTLEECQALGMPSLERIFYLSGPRSLYLDLKTSSCDATLAIKVVEMLKRYNKINCYVGSFNQYIVQYLVQARKEHTFELGLIVDARPSDDYASLIKKYRPDAISLCKDMVDPILIKNLKRHRLQIMVYTVNTAEEANYLIDCGVDGLITNFPRI
jgi:glycerophosphoryl diester phosphodiesterase